VNLSARCRRNIGIPASPANRMMRTGQRLYCAPDSNEA
jgi:hypothetical protein